MKVRVKGLVFVGFAAAIFAQSAMADNNADAKTVTSKLYVDQKIDAEETSGTSTIVANSPNNKAPSSKNVYDFVIDKVSNAVGEIQGDDVYVKAHDVTVGTGNNAHTVRQVDLQQTPMTAGSGITGTLTDDNNGVPGTKKALVTAQAVKDLFDSTISSADDGTLLATSQAVYNYAQPKVDDATDSLKVGYLGTANGATATWKTLKLPNATNALPTTAYVARKADASGNYDVNIDSDTIASLDSDITTAGGGSATAAQQAKLTTAKAVYDFVTDQNRQWQPKIADNNTGKIMFGRQTSSTNGGSTVYNNGWGELVVGDVASGSHVTSTNYVAKEETSTGVYSIDLDAAQIANYGVTATGQTNQIVDNSEKLATANAVFEYVQSQTGGNLIPAPGNDCSLGENGITDSNNHACALVLAYWAAGESPTGQAGVGLKWVPMPQP